MKFNKLRKELILKMKDIIKPSILPGFMELLPKDQIIFNDMVKKITKVYENSGFMPIDTPIIEKAEVLLAKSAGETEKQVYMFTRGKNELALRFDLTVPFSRYVAQHYNELTFPFKRYQIGKVYRGERNQRGRYREFYQCDVDIVGNSKLDIKNDALIVNTVYKALMSIGIKDFKIQISNRKILKGILEELQVNNENEVMILIDKIDKISRVEFEQELNKLVGDTKSKKLIELIMIAGNNKEILSKLKEIDSDNELYKLGVEELQIVIDVLSLFGVKEDNIKIDLKIIRGLDYYTGTVFETILNNHEEFGSISSGGRYDNLAENYTTCKLPGVGMSIGITRLFYVLSEIGFLDDYIEKDTLDYLIIPIGDTFEYAAKIYEALQKEETRVDIYLDNDKFKKIMNYANKIDAKNIILVGEEEMKSGVVSIKNMISGEQRTVQATSAVQATPRGGLDTSQGCLELIW